MGLDPKGESGSSRRLARGCRTSMTMVPSLRSPAAGRMRVAGMVWMASGSGGGCLAVADEPPVHYLHAGAMPPGAIGRPATPARRAIARIFPAGRNHGAAGRHDFAGRPGRFHAPTPGTTGRRHVDRRGLSAEGDQHPRPRRTRSLSDHRSHRPALSAGRARNAAFRFPSRSRRKKSSWPCRADS